MAHPTIVRHFEAAGIERNGPQPWDPQVHDPGLYRDLIRGGSLALEEGYVTYACLLQNQP
jgi:cyclopropane-fatty-acyl-phospholipid synthase